MTFEHLELRDKMSWIGYRKYKLSLWDRIKLLLSGCGSHKESAEFRLVSVLTNNDFHSYSLDPNAYGFFKLGIKKWLVLCTHTSKNI